MTDLPNPLTTEALMDRAPIHIDPLLGEVFELLHRMTTSKDEALKWHAWDAIAKLRKYEEQVGQNLKGK